jgi:putative hydrolase of the HAD superfamily
VALLRELHAAGHELYFLSNMPAPYADHLQSSNDFMAASSTVSSAGAWATTSPSRPSLKLAAKRFGAATPHDLLFLDDHLPNIAGGAGPWAGRRCSSPTRRRRARCCMSGRWWAERR